MTTITTSDAARDAPSWQSELLPDGRALGIVPAHELNRIARELGISVAPTASHTQTIAAYLDYRRAIYHAGGAAADAQWLASKRSAA